MKSLQEESMLFVNGIPYHCKMASTTMYECKNVAWICLQSLQENLLIGSEKQVSSTACCNECVFRRGTQNSGCLEGDWAVWVWGFLHFGIYLVSFSL